MLTESAPTRVGVRCLGADVATPGWRVRNPIEALGTVPSASTSDPGDAKRPLLRNTVQDALEPRECGFTYARVRWVASDLRLGRRAARDGVSASASLVATLESANDGE